MVWHARLTDYETIEWEKPDEILNDIDLDVPFRHGDFRG